MSYIISFSEMAKGIRDTEANFEKMLFKEAVKTGFFEYQVRGSVPLPCMLL